MAKETAEQKLLKLIESTDSKDTAVIQPMSSEAAVPYEQVEAKQVLESVKGLGVPSFTLPPFIKNLTNILLNPKSILKLSLKEINNLLITIIIILIVFFSFDFSKGFKGAHAKVYFDIPEKVSALTDNLFPAFQELSRYLDVVSRRNIFHPYERKKIAEAMKMPKEYESIQEVSVQAKELRLVGISWLNSADTATAMIENTKSGITHFLTKGQKINEVVVEEIYSDSVIVSYQGEEMEIKL